MRRVLLGVALSCSILFAITLTLGWSASPVAAQGGKAVGGTVKFTGTAPANPKIDMSEEPTCKAKTPNAVDPVVVVNKGGLADVFIYVKSGLPAGAKGPAATAPVVIDQSGCLYHPRVLGLVVNQPLEIRNSDALLH